MEATNPATRKRRTKKAAKKTTTKAPARRGRKPKEAAAVDASEAAIRLDNDDALRFGKLDAELRNAILGLQLVELEVQKLDTDYRVARNGLAEKKRGLTSEIARRRGEYKSLVDGLALRYDIPAERMSIDPDSGIVHDHKATTT